MDSAATQGMYNGWHAIVITDAMYKLVILCTYIAGVMFWKSPCRKIFAVSQK